MIDEEDDDGKGKDVAVMKLAVYGMIEEVSAIVADEEGLAGDADAGVVATAAAEDGEEEAAEEEGWDAECDEGAMLLALSPRVRCWLLLCESCCCGVSGGEGVVVSAEGSEVVRKEGFMAAEEGHEREIWHEDILRCRCGGLLLLLLLLGEVDAVTSGDPGCDERGQKGSTEWRCGGGGFEMWWSVICIRRVRRAMCVVCVYVYVYVWM